MKFTLADIERLKKEGKIAGFNLKKPAHKAENGRKVVKHFKQKSKAKDFVAKNLFLWCAERSLVLLQEYKFDESRRWKADYAIPEMRLLIEYEGLFSERSRHTTATGFTGDTDKYRAAAMQNWIVLRYTALNYKNLVSDLDKIKRDT